MNNLELIMHNYKGGTKQTAIAEKGVEIVATLIRKNIDYGDSAFQVPLLAPDLPADAGIRVRMSDKINRLKTLLKDTDPEVDESIDDTMKDLAGYVILWLVNKEKTNE